MWPLLRSVSKGNNEKLKITVDNRKTQVYQQGDLLFFPVEVHNSCNLVGLVGEGGKTGRDVEYKINQRTATEETQVSAIQSLFFSIGEKWEGIEELNFYPEFQEQLIRVVLTPFFARGEGAFGVHQNLNMNIVFLIWFQKLH